MKRRKSGQFRKGARPWNKGLKGIHLSPLSEFNGASMEKHPCWKGGVHHLKNDCAYVMVGCRTRVRRPRKIYEDAYGKIPEGHVIFHVDGNKDNDELSNLEAISRAELVKRNSRR